MDIVIPTYNEHYNYMTKFLDTFSLNCEDKDNVVINLVVTSDDYELFNKLIPNYQKLKINIMILKDLVKKYENIDVDENTLLNTIGKFTFQSLKKLYGSLETGNKYICLFDSECLFIRKFKMSDYINNNLNRYMYCSKMTHNMCTNTHANYIQNLMNDLMNTSDNNWYLEVYLWILRRDILLELKTFLENKCGKLTSHNEDTFIEYCYYLYCKINKNKYPEIQWIDTYTLIQDHIAEELFINWCDNTHPWCLFEHIGLHLSNCSYDQLDAVCLIYKLLNFPIFRLIPNNKFNVMLLIACNEIKICVSEYCSDVYNLTLKNMFNKKLGLFVSGLYHKCDDINSLLEFIYPLKINIHYYLSSQEPSIYKTLLNHPLTKTLFIDNTIHYFDFEKIKYKPTSKPDTIQNTIEMFFKKTTFLKYLKNYNIVIQMRPDLISYNKNLIDLIYDMFMNYNNDTLYTPLLYSKYGITTTFSMGTSNTMKYYLNIYNNIHELLDKYIFNPELLTYLHIKHNNITFYPLNWDFKINWHGSHLLNEWWRTEPYFNITPNIFNQYLNLKTSSYQIIENIFSKHANTKYTFTHALTKKHLYVADICDVNGITLSDEKSNITSFYITPPTSSICHRINIVLDR